jgi:hypothetical protein
MIVTKHSEAEAIAREFVRGSIIEQATVRLVTQIVEEMLAVKAEQVGPLKAELERLEDVRNCIRLNAIKGMGCSEEEAEAYANGTSNTPFVVAMAEFLSKPHGAQHPDEVG